MKEGEESFFFPELKTQSFKFLLDGKNENKNFKNLDLFKTTDKQKQKFQPKTTNIVE